MTLEQECEALAGKLRADRTFAELLIRAGIARCHPNARENVVVLLASYPLMLAMPAPASIKARNDKMLAAIAKFKHAIGEFGIDGSTPPLLRDALEHYSENQRLRFGPCPPARHLPTVTITDYLDMLANQIEEGAYWHPDYMDRLVSTPSGQMPRTRPALASWLAIRAMKTVGLPPGNAFNEAAAYAASMLCGEHVDPETIKTMTKEDGPYDPAAGVY